MSNRALKKFLIDKGFEDFQNQNIVINEIEAHINSDNQINPFDMLDDDKDVEKVNYENEKALNSALSPNENNNPTIKIKKKNKKKSNKNLIHKIENNYIESDLLQYIPVNSYTNNICGIDMRNLNPETEMKKIFGKLIYENDTINGRKKKYRYAYTKMKLIKTKANWVPISKLGLTMVEIESLNSDGILHFCFKHSTIYQIVQQAFCALVSAFDQNGLMELHRDHPYHIDTLIQLSITFAMHEEYESAALLIEQAIYAMESNFHSRFNLTDQNIRLEYKYRENRCFHIALFYHALNQNHSGCSRTALEICKLMLNLDNQDPLAILLMIDYLALKSKEYTFLIRFYNHYRTKFNLDVLPNYCFSVPLAYKLCHIATLQATSHVKTNKNKKKNRSANEIDINEGNLEVTAEKMLKEAIFKFPKLFFELLSKCGIDPDNFCQTIKSDVFEKFYQTSRRKKLSPLLEKLVNRYSNLCHPLWKQNGGIHEADDFLLLDWMTNVVANDPNAFITDYNFKINNTRNNDGVFGKINNLISSIPSFYSSAQKFDPSRDESRDKIIDVPTTSSNNIPSSSISNYRSTISGNEISLSFMNLNQISPDIHFTDNLGLIKSDETSSDSISSTIFNIYESTEVPLNICRHFLLLTQYHNQSSDQTEGKIFPILPYVNYPSGNVCNYDPFPPPNGISAYDCKPSDYNFNDNSHPLNRNNHTNYTLDHIGNHNNNGRGGENFSMGELVDLLGGFVTSLSPFSDSLRQNSDSAVDNPNLSTQANLPSHIDSNSLGDILRSVRSYITHINTDLNAVTSSNVVPPTNTVSNSNDSNRNLTNIGSENDNSEQNNDSPNHNLNIANQNITGETNDEEASNNENNASSFGIETIAQGYAKPGAK